MLYHAWLQDHGRQSPVLLQDQDLGQLVVRVCPQPLVFQFELLEK